MCTTLSIVGGTIEELGQSLTREKVGLMLLAIGLIVGTFGGAVSC